MSTKARPSDLSVRESTADAQNPPQSPVPPASANTAPTTPEAEPSAPPFEVMGRYSIVAWRQDGLFYPGDLICDLVEYRILRASSFKNPLKAAQVAHLSSLEEKLRQSSAGSDQDDLETRLRAFQRYDCLYPASISYVIEPESRVTHRMAVRIEDTSAGGVKVSSKHSFEPGDPVTLHLEKLGPDCDEIRFPSRVAWTTAIAFGLMFAGPPQTKTKVNDQGS